MKRKLLSLLMLLAVSAVTLCGCGKEGDSAAAEANEEESVSDNIQSGGTVDLNVWAEEDSFKVVNMMIESFKEEYKGQADFNITLTAQPDSNAKDALLDDVHNAGDVFSFPDDQLYGLLAAGLLEPIDDQSGIKSAIVDGAISAATYNDTVYAIPYTADNGYFLYYNKKYFTPKDLETMDGILAAAEAAEKKVSMELNSGWYMYSFFGGTGLEFGINDDGVTNHCNWNATDTAIKGVDVGQAIIDIAEHPAFIAQPDSDFVAGAKNGSVAAGISGTWNAMAIKEAWGNDYSAVKLPTYTVAGKQVQMTSFTGYKMMGVNAYSKNKEWAMKLAKWMTNEENQTLRFEVMNQGPANKNAAASDAVTAVPAIQAVMAQSEYGTLQRVGGKYWAPCTAFIDTITSGSYQNFTVQELMDTLVAGITQSAAN